MRKTGKQQIQLNGEVSRFLDELDHPLRNEIEQLRKIILDAHPGITENIKWNGPNYCLDEKDRITMKIQPPKQIQLIFHRGVKVQETLPARLIDDNSGLLEWKGNDRAVATFKTMDTITTRQQAITGVIIQWLHAAS